jgi:polar amino acid transport system substrate-binding protein
VGALGFDSIILGVGSGKYDIGVSSFTVNDERKQAATMISYFKAGTQWVTQKGNPKKVDPNNACGLNIAVQKGTVQVDDLTARQEQGLHRRRQAEINPLVDGDQGKVTAMVQSGKADAMLVDLPPAIAAVETGGTVRVARPAVRLGPLRLRPPKAETDFAQTRSSSALKKLQADGELHQDPDQVEVPRSGAITDFAVNP